MVPAFTTDGSRQARKDWWRTMAISKCSKCGSRYQHVNVLADGRYSVECCACHNSVVVGRDGQVVATRT